ncbi:serine/threonine-protein kinase [Actinomadura parmotrematis]|nr:serine/threonine protein kinase [Actinomadura parmotrematis]
MPNETPGERLLARRYRLVTHVGRGGMGTVWKAHDEVLGRDVAVKEVILPHGLTDEERSVQYKRTFREARTAARLGHPNVVTVYDVVEEDGRPWIIMELIQARSLDQVIKEEGPFEVKRAAELGRQMLAALHAAHDAGVLHRDVKPSNVLVTTGPAGDRAVLTDFGIATASGDATLTQTGLVMGSPAYIAPERARGRTAGPASDLWSLGVTLFAMVHGKSPFERSEPMAALVAVISEDPDPPTRAGRLAPVIEGLLNKNPDLRMDAIEAGALLDDIVRQESVDTQRTLAVELPPPPDATRAERAVRDEPAPPPARSEPTDGRTRVTPAVADAGGPAEAGTAGAAFGSDPTSPAARPPARSGEGWTPNRNALLVGVGVLVALLLVVGIAWASTKGDGKKDGDGGGGASPATSKAAPSSAKPSSAPPSTPPPSSSAPAPSAGGVPAGWKTYKDRAGYSMYLPEDWSSKPRRDSNGDYFRASDGSVHLQLAYQEKAGPSALDDWQSEPGKGNFRNYKKLFIRPVTEGYPVADPTGAKAADWSWTYDEGGRRMRALNRGFVMNGHGYSILLFAPESEWDKTFAEMQPLYKSFKGAP